jgi:antitoxin component YwqK of YwqJK toxin-antitoxin module
MITRYFVLTLLAMMPLLLPAQNLTDVEGRKQGPWVKKYPNGKIMYEGTFRNDTPVGLFKRYNEEGILISELTYGDGNDETAAVFFHPDGTKAAEGIYMARMKEGLWRFWSATTPPYLISEEHYHQDLRHGLSKKYYPDSTLAETVTWDSGMRTGEWLQYYPDGAICLRAEYIGGKLEGPFSYYHRNGNLYYEGHYSEDLKTGDWMVFYENGKLKQIIEYREGRPTDPKVADQETKFLDDLEKNRDRIKVTDINQSVIR